MDHLVASVDDLYADAKGMMDLCNGDLIGYLDTLASSIETLKSNWEGKDAGVQIQNIIKVHNSLADLRTDLTKLASSASVVASDYRDVQIVLKPTLSAIPALPAWPSEKLDDYSDNRDLVSINGAEALTAATDIGSVSQSVDGLVSQVQGYYDSILSNWTSGKGRDVAQETFDSFIANAKSYKESLNGATQYIRNCVQRYNS